MGFAVGGVQHRASDSVHVSAVSTVFVEFSDGVPDLDPGDGIFLGGLELLSDARPAYAVGPEYLAGRFFVSWNRAFVVCKYGVLAPLGDS